MTAVDFGLTKKARIGQIAIDDAQENGYTSRKRIEEVIDSQDWSAHRLTILDALNEMAESGLLQHEKHEVCWYLGKEEKDL